MTEGDGAEGAAARRFLFVCGSARSGTTALWALLNAHPRIVLGKERYNGRILATDAFTPALFEKERFFRLEAGDTFYTDLEAFEPTYARMAERFDDALLVGDKTPRLHHRLPQIARAFPGATVVVILRNLIDVADSFQRRALDAEDRHWRRDRDARAAIGEWNTAIRNVLPFVEGTDKGLDLVVVAYEELFSEAGTSLDPLFARIGIPAMPAAVAAYRALLRNVPALSARRGLALSSDDRFEICSQGAFGHYRRLLAARLVLPRAEGAPPAPQPPSISPQNAA